MNQGSNMHCHTLVLGAGIVGVCTALHLQAAGHSVALLDRDEPGRGASHGNAGLIERSSVIPHAFPRQFSQLLRYGLNRQSDVRYSLTHLPRAASWLLRYWQQSAPDKLAGAGRAMLPLVERSVIEHDLLADAAGVSNLIKAEGWMELYRDQSEFDKAVADASALQAYGLRYEVLDRTQLHAREPHLQDSIVGGIHWFDPKTVSDPGALTRGYAALFIKRGGQFIQGDALTLKQLDGGWQVQTEQGPVSAEQAVIALGPQAPELFKPLGYRIPLAIKRGYHMHYSSLHDAQLQHSICDAQGGYVLAPMAQGIRL